MNKEILMVLMKEWLTIPTDEDIAIQQMFVIINSYESYKIQNFYAHFAPLMAQIIDGDL